MTNVSSICFLFVNDNTLESRFYHGEVLNCGARSGTHEVQITVSEATSFSGIVNSNTNSE